MTDFAATFHDLVRVETTLWNGVDARLREQCGLTLARFETMQILQRSGPCRVLDIAEELAISWGGASKIVDRVEAAGHCRRGPNPADARSSLITLTARGRTVMVTATACFTAEVERRFTAALTSNQLDELARSLSKLRRTPVLLA